MERHLPWGFFPFGEISTTDRFYVGLPRQHPSFSEFLTLSTIWSQSYLVALFRATSALRILAYRGFPTQQAVSPLGAPSSRAVECDGFIEMNHRVIQCARLVDWTFFKNGRHIPNNRFIRRIWRLLLIFWVFRRIASVKETRNNRTTALSTSEVWSSWVSVLFSTSVTSSREPILSWPSLSPRLSNPTVEPEFSPHDLFDAMGFMQARTPWILWSSGYRSSRTWVELREFA